MSGILQVWQRVMNLLAPGKIPLSDDSGSVMRSQFAIGSLELLNGVPVIQHFGFSSVPPAGSDGIAVFMSGDRSNSVIIATANATARPKNKAAGETVIFNAFGMTIYLSASGIAIDGGGMPISITNCPTLTQNGDIHATGKVIAGFGGADQVGLQTHTHPVPDGGGTSSAPNAGT